MADAIFAEMLEKISKFDVLSPKVQFTQYSALN
jgi:hypothetical protein